MNNHVAPSLTQSQIDALTFLIHHYKTGNLLATIQICHDFLACLPDSTPEKQMFLNDITGLKKIVNLLAHVNTEEEPKASEAAQ
ncbi:MAG TPA: hypothetical protein PKZ53_08765 [Acidobacteriota bacterium]|nr:hypothetical protein [Acidobacteriota bacterium]HNB69932.1 hypothetical protein [Acidobacteriota bacterium]HNJ40567.1 hypothetical protein [Acidobacteriota bacterium]